MRKLLLSLVLTLAVSAPAVAQVAGPFFTMTVTSGAVIGFDAPTLAALTVRGIDSCSGVLEGGDIRYRYDAAAASVSSTVGRPLSAPQPITLEGVDLITRFRARAVAGNGTISWTCEPSSGTTGVVTGASPAVVGATPLGATYITQTPDATLTAEQALDALATGILRVDTATGILTSLVDSAGLAANLSDEEGTGVVVYSINAALTTPDLGTPSAIVLTNATGTVTNLSLVTPDIGTPSAGVGTNLTGVPIASGVSGLGANVATALATPSSANLLAAVTDPTGTGLAVFGTAPNLSRSVEAQIVTKTPTEAESGLVITNAGDADGSLGVMPNDPSVTGLYYTWIAVEAQTITLTAPAGETLESAGATCGTSITLTDGDSVTLMNATSGSGAQWHVVAGVGFACDA